MRRTIMFSLVALSGAPVFAQTDATHLLLSSNTVSPVSPTTTIEIWATWLDPAGDFYFGGGNYDMTADEGVFSNPVNVLNGPGSSTGAIVGNVISGAANGQFCTIFGCPPSVNPILIAKYDWTTAVFSKREVGLDTSGTNNFVLVSTVTGGVVQLFPDEFTPGSGVIKVVPSPAVFLVLPLVAARRRRQH